MGFRLSAPAQRCSPERDLARTGYIGAPASAAVWESQFDNVIGWIPKSLATCSNVTPSSRFWATLTTSSQNSFGYGFGMATSFQARPRASQIRCHRTVPQTHDAPTSSQSMDSDTERSNPDRVPVPTIGGSSVVRVLWERGRVVSGPGLATDLFVELGVSATVVCESVRRARLLE